MSVYEFPFKTLPAIMRGPRVERRRVLWQGSTHWATLLDDTSLQIDDGRSVLISEVTHLPPCEPTKIICVHLSYSSRSMETRNKAKPTETPTYFTKPPTALNSHGGLLVKPADCQYLNYEGEFATKRGITWPDLHPHSTWVCKIFATPIRAPCCG
jgi:5-oxopent-3-ene-1,2,5-tricarboxylate decarboxylase / 2-hydroxyhepta-2,4-diene-1,7-dioate isomerase